MTTLKVLPEQHIWARFGWGVTDAWTVAKRDINHWIAQPAVIIVGLLFPVMLLVIFGSLFGGAISIPGALSYYDFLVPGILAMTMFFGLESTMIAVTTDADKGVTDRFRSMPMNASAVVVGRSIADMINSTLSLAVLVGAGFALGWRWHSDLGSGLAAFGLLLLLRFALLWVGIYLGLVVKGPQSVAAVQILVWPLSFLSSAFVDPNTMPSWLGAVAEWNPLSATASATRELFANPGFSATSWVTHNSILMAILWPTLLIAVFLPAAARRYRRLAR